MALSTQFINNRNIMKTINNTPLVLAFIIVVVVFLLFCGGAITMTMIYSEMNKNGLMNNVSWLWLPALIAFILSILLGWALFWKRDDKDV
jgi:H+/Cl- antiporter ClcA